MNVKKPALYQQCFWLILHTITWLILGGIGCVATAIVIVAFKGQSAGLAWLQTLVHQDYATLSNMLQSNTIMRLYRELRLIPDVWIVPPINLPMISDYTQQQCWLQLLPFISGALLGTKLLLIKMFVLLHGVLLFLFLGCVGLVDGFTQRAIRRMAAGRESALLYHQAKRCIVISLMLSMFIYLIAPLPISQASWIIAIAAVVLGMAIQLTTKTFKKYV